MTKFVVSSEVPENLPKDVYVIRYPNFAQEIEENKKREPRGGITAANHLRSIAGSIGARYDENLTAYSVRPHLFEGRLYKDDSELSAVVVEMLESQYPAIFEKYLDYQIKNRPSNTKLVYYVGKPINTAPFFTNGLDSMTEKEALKFLGLKETKTVGRPAITDEQAQAQAQSQEAQ